MTKLVSILIPAYNAEKWINNTIESALSQTWPNKEIIVVDDGSNDNTFLNAKKYESKKVYAIRQQNRGVSAARNMALSNAQGHYIQWLDADDILAPDKIERQMDILKKYGDGVLASGRFGSFYYRIEKAVFRETEFWRDLSPLDWILTRFTEYVWMQAGAWLISRELCERAGPWDERLILDEDGEYFCRVVSMSEGVKFVHGAKSYYRIGNFGSQGMNRSIKALESLLLSMELSFKVLKSMEDSERTRNSCLKFLQSRVIDYFPDNYEIMAKAEKLARELGGILIRPEDSLKLYGTEKILGWRKKIMRTNIARKIKKSVLRNIDKLIYDINQRKDPEP
jgi:glycosyltransferase involved in cell wall biosynthesis